MLEVPGNELTHQTTFRDNSGHNQQLNHYMVDDNYLVVGNHIDEATRVRIENNEYVDFARLLP